MAKAAKPGVGQGKGGGRPRRQGAVVQVRLSLPGGVARRLEDQARREDLPMWEVVARLIGDGTPAPAKLRAAAPGRSGITQALLATEIQRLTRPTLGLCFVPDLVMALLQHGSLPQVHAALLEANGRTLELRPESGLNRLSALELALCPQGLQETRLSWTRGLSATQTFGWGWPGAPKVKP